MTKQRLDQLLALRGLVASRSQAESFIKLGHVIVDGKTISKPGYFAPQGADIKLKPQVQYVSRAGLKLESVAKTLNLNFKDKVVLDVGSSTGGFTDYALKNGAKKVIAIDVGTEQLHKSLIGNKKIELHEQTDIRNVKKLSAKPDIVVIDVSFISLREILPFVAKLLVPGSQIVAMFKPQFEAGSDAKHKGVIKNNSMRRDLLKSFEIWLKNYFVISAKADSEVTGGKGNKERFYLLTLSKKTIR